MHTVRLIRLEENFIHGTFGVLIIDGVVFCCTLEPPDQLNQTSISSIPAQQYICERYKSTNHPNTFQVMNVPGRTKILFHAGNFLRNTEGCILLGQYFGKLKNSRGTMNSGKTFERFMEIMEDVDKFHFTIKECY